MPVLSILRLGIGVGCLVALTQLGFSVQESKRDLTVQGPGTGAALDGRGRQWSVVIGVSKYKHVPASAQLRFAHRDAEEFARFLTSAQGGGFRSSQIRLLRDDEASLAAIRTALGTWLPRSAEPEDLVYIFFAGHGVVENDSEGYLLAHDSDPQNLYATALSIGELNSILAQRLRARHVILIADACHSGKIGWTSRSTGQEVLINRYLAELGKSASGVFKLMASRAEERSYEDERWGGGHGVFTHSLLQGLQGKADRDRDGVVRAAELVDYLSEVVPEETKAMQHPRVAGNLDARLPLAVLSGASAALPVGRPEGLKMLSLEVRGTAGSEVYLDKSYRGKIRPEGVLIIDQVSPGSHELAVDLPGAGSVSQQIEVAEARTTVEVGVQVAKQPVLQSSPLVARVRLALRQEQLFGQDGAWSLFQRLVAESPADPQRVVLETELSRELEEVGQQAINAYVRSSPLQIRKGAFRQASAAFGGLQTLRPSDKLVEAKRLFCEGRALIEEDSPQKAVPVLKQALTLDPKAAYTYNALGLAFERMGEHRTAFDMFSKASELAPFWSVPRLHLALLHQESGKWKEAEREYQSILETDSTDILARIGLIRLLRARGRLPEAEVQALELAGQNPGYPPAFVELGLIYDVQGEHAKAADAFQRYLELAPGAPDQATVQALIDKNRGQVTRRRPSLKSSDR
ncbi:MAG: caspase family protein [Acidobacteriota bacterium]